jgi:hypothetical protein
MILQKLHDSCEERNLSPGQNAQADHIRTFLKGRRYNLFRRLMESRVDDFESFILEGLSNKLRSTIMAVQTGFRD